MSRRLLQDLTLPFPDKEWYSFNVSVLGTTVRDEDPARCLTSDMCVPIFPNEYHPTGRVPVNSKPPFPFTNCYHWLSSKIKVRVRNREDGWDDDVSVRLPAMSQISMGTKFSDDTVRVWDALKARAELSATPPGGSSQGTKVTQSPGPGDATAPNSDDTMSIHSEDSDCSSLIDSDDSSNEDSSVPAVAQIFGNPQKDAETFPIVDLWYNLTDYLTEDTIPSPADLFKERDAIVK